MVLACMSARVGLPDGQDPLIGFADLLSSWATHLYTHACPALKEKFECEVHISYVLPMPNPEVGIWANLS